ncbi:NB-ARC domain-containing protein [Amycolatopsis mongoliensis]|uniref:NB-ARC domain-containing protein n=1 Tax=Amycolatopsis mongoliensis TaxID=715475 RepID=A0A9Y2JW26_9PSEU|nr:NB-ARC domain-containing protein [Amycolatopsis sp. 4-36]WIY05758.1 NB-ARC domain-containing protein [Amycolatopsis sp. 4-36]
MLSSAASGRRLPTLAVTLAFVAACGGDQAAWERHWWNTAAKVGVMPELAGGGPPPAASGPVPAAARRSSQLAPPAQLPMGSTSFVGRTAELAAAVSVLTRPGPARMPLLISGPIGVGKAAFALRLAEEVAGEFPDGQLYADFGSGAPGSRSVAEIVRDFLRALGVPDDLVPGDGVQQIGLYRSLLAQRRLFVLLDGVADEGQVRPLLGQTARSQVVLTSRARLLGLDDLHRVDLDVFSRGESLELLGRLAGARRVAAERAAADAIAQQCGDLPLAVNIAGRKIAARPERTIADTAGRLDDPERLLDGLGVGDVNVRDRFAAAYRLLSPACRQVVHRLGADGARWTTATRVAACLDIRTTDADELLESLVDAGVLRRATIGDRYTVPRLAGVFAAETSPATLPAPISLAERRARRSVLAAPRTAAGLRSGMDLPQAGYLPLLGLPD